MAKTRDRREACWWHTGEDWQGMEVVRWVVEAGMQGARYGGEAGESIAGDEN